MQEEIQALRDQYDIECLLAQKIKNAKEEERKGLYGEIYNQFIRQFPTAMIHAKSSHREALVASAIVLLTPFLSKDSIFLEIGSGDCEVSRAIAKYCDKVYAADVSNEIAILEPLPENIELILFNGFDFPIDNNSINTVYSSDLIEHLHPNDALDQLINIKQLLKPGGVYICFTPNRIYGPHDISRLFGDEYACGLHIHEYTIFELSKLFNKAGFEQLSLMIKYKNRYREIPTWPIICLEIVINLLPRAFRNRVTSWPRVRTLLGIIFVAKI